MTFNLVPAAESLTATEKFIKALDAVAAKGGGWVLWVMLALSIVSITFMLERVVFHLSRRENIDILGKRLMDCLRRGDRPGLERTLKASNSIEARVVLGTVEWIEEGPEAFEEAAEAEFGKAKRDLGRFMTFLGTIGNNAPFIGLFGTVLSVVQAFQRLGDAQQTNASQAADSMPQVISAIAEALIATGFGLFVAIPAVISFNYLTQRNTQVEENVHILVRQILAYLKSRSREEAAGASNNEQAAE
jgi:biopolymer transport protein ExbB/biopolymer transport protein TolQ